MSNSKLGERFFFDTVHADVVFLVENEEIPGHRNVFAISCSYFDKLLYGDFKESKSSKVEITGASAKIFNEVKRFIYLGQLKIEDWNIEELLGLLAVAHEFQYPELFAEVVEALEKQPLDFDTWTLVNSAATVYDSAALKAKCVSFAEAEVDNFVCLKNMEKMTDEFICVMFETPKIGTVDQDQLLSSLLQWKKTHSSSHIRSVLPKICWNGVSHDTIALMAKLLLLNLKNEDEGPLCNQLLANIQVQSQFIFKAEIVLLSRGKPVYLSMKKHDCVLYCYNGNLYLQFNFKKNNADFEIPVKRIELEFSNQYQIQKVCGWTKLNLEKEVDYKELTSSNDWLKYSATFSEEEPVYNIGIYLKNFAAASEIILRSLVIY